MTFVFGFILGFLLAYLAPTAEKLAARLQRPSVQTAEKPHEDAERARRTERALREYRNFMTYDGYAQQDDQP